MRPNQPLARFAHSVVGATMMSTTLPKGMSRCPLRPKRHDTSADAPAPYFLSPSVCTMPIAVTMFIRDRRHECDSKDVAHRNQAFKRDFSKVSPQRKLIGLDIAEDNILGTALCDGSQDIFGDLCRIYTPRTPQSSRHRRLPCLGELCLIRPKNDTLV